jgi:LacI family transcriptional regulator
MSRRRQAVTIKHVAAHAGVSLQSVSRVLNDGPHVRPAMRAKVQAAIDELGYVPSIAARRMSGTRSYLILAINDRQRTIADWRSREGGDWVDQMLLGGMLKCAEHGYRLIFELVDTHNDHVERELAAALASLRPDGVVLTPPHSDNPLICRLLEEHHIPFARIGTHDRKTGIALTMDDEGSARAATEHLIGLGHRAIGFIAGSTDYSLSEWRIGGWRDAMEGADLPTVDLLARGDFSYGSGLEAATRLLALSDRPSAIIASSDQMTLAALEAAKNAGLEVPRDLSLISFDNTPIVRFSQPALTAIDQPIAETVARAVELLIEAVKTGARPEDVVTVSGDLIERSSTAPPPG